MRKGEDQLGRPSILYKNTKATIEAFSGLTGGEVAYATDTGEDGVYDAVGAAWVWGRAGGGSSDGWTEVTDSWSYASASTINVPTDATTDYVKGVKIRLKQGGAYKYYVGKTIAATLITVIVNADFTVANTAITDIAISYNDSPGGWPEWFAFTPTISGTGFSIGNGVTVGKYRPHGLNGIFVKERLTGGSTTSWGTGFLNFGLPVDASYIVNFTSLESSAGNILDSSASTRYALAAFVRTSDMRGIYANGILLQGTPITFATNDEINLSAFYEW